VPPVSFPFELRIDGLSYRARRLDGTRQYTATFVPQVRGQQAQVQLDPLNTADWGDGRGWGLNADTSEGVIMPGAQVTAMTLPSVPGADLEQFAEQDGHLYVVGGRYAYRIPNGSDPAVQDQDLGAAFAAVSIVPWKSSLIVGGRTSGNIWEKPSGGAWTNAMTAGAVQRGKLTTVWWNTGTGNSLRLVGEGATPTGLTYVAANARLDTDWQSAITIGSYPIRSMVATRYHAYVGTTGGLFDFGSDGTAPNLTPDIEKLVMDSNGRATLAMDGWVYLNGGYTLYRVRAVGAAGDAYGLVQECGWSAQLPRQCPMSGYVTALAKHGPWLWAAIYDGTNTWLCKAREATANDRFGPLVWFVSPIYLPGLKVTALHTSGLVSMNPRLWLAVTTGGGTRELRWAHLPLDSAYRDLRQARLYRFTTSAQYDEPEEDHGDDSMPKFVREIVAETENTSGSTQDALSVATDGAATFTPIGTFTSNPRSMLHPPQTILASRYILRHALSGTTATPPIVRKRSTRVIPRPDLLEVRAYQLVVGAAVRASDGAVEGRSIKTTRRRLARLQRIGPVPMLDEEGTPLSVFVAAGEVFTEVEATLGDAQSRRVLTVDFQAAVLATSGGTRWRWGDLTEYGEANKVWA
jgi:hypothetical protein